MLKLCSTRASVGFPKLICTSTAYSICFFFPTVLTPGKTAYDGSFWHVWQQMWLKKCVHGWPPLCCRAPVEWSRCCLLTQPSPRSLESNTALSRNISRHSTSESPFLAYHTHADHKWNRQREQRICSRAHISWWPLRMSGDSLGSSAPPCDGASCWWTHTVVSY